MKMPTNFGMKISLLLDMKMPIIVGIFIFISRENFMLSWVEHKKNNLGARLPLLLNFLIVAHKASGFQRQRFRFLFMAHPAEGFLEVYEDIREIFLMLKMFPALRSNVLTICSEVLGNSLVLPRWSLLSETVVCWVLHSTLVISKSKGLSEILRDIRTSTYQICRIEKKINQTTTFLKWICNLTPEVRGILKILWERGEIAP